MKYHYIMIMLLALPLPAAALDLETITAIEAVDAVNRMQAFEVFESVCTELPADPARDQRLAAVLAIYQRDQQVLTKGTAARITAEILDLKQSFFYIIVGFERYDFRACAAAGFMSIESDTSEPVSGNELLELALKIQQYHGVQ
jgi:hypothetical protein